MKKIIFLAVILFAAAVQLGAERWNFQVTVTAGTAQRIATGPIPFFLDRLMIQSRSKNTGTALIMLGVPLATPCSATSTSQLSAELGPGDTLHPGGTLSDPQGANGNPPSEVEDMRLACLDGTVSGDKLLVTGWHRN